MLSDDPPITVIGVERGELDDLSERGGHTLLWLWPAEGPEAPRDPRLLRKNNRLEALALEPGQSVTIQRGVAPTPTLDKTDEGWELRVPSDKLYADVSRAPTRVALHPDGQLSVETDARGPQRFWIDLSPRDGPQLPTPVDPWAALAVGPVVLWYVPLALGAAYRHQTPVLPPTSVDVAGFRCFSEATAAVVAQLRRRADMRLLVPRAAASGRWEARQPFILAGEPGSGKTTLAKAVYQEARSGRFAAVHPVAVEQEVDLIALTGSANFAHDGVKVPDQDGHLDVVTRDDGVVLVDEVHTLDDRLKKHLIDLLTEWTFRPRGDNTLHRKVRGLLVFATNQLAVLRDPARFPADLFARMGGEAGIIEVPPLRKRRWEVPRLADAVLAGLPPRAEAERPRLSQNAVRKLLLHSWPLNHWELEDTVREAHSLALSEGATVIQPQLLKLRPPGARPTGPLEQVGRDRPTPVERAAPLAPVGHEPFRFAESASWTDLFTAFHVHPSFASVRDAWQIQLGVKNAAAVNRRIGRLIRCDRCEPTSCPRCFLGVVAQTDADELIHRLERLGQQVEVPQGQRHGWISGALRELVVERVELFKNDAVRSTLPAPATASRANILELLATLKARL